MKRKVRVEWNESWQPIEYLAEADTYGWSDALPFEKEYRKDLMRALAHTEKVLRSVSNRDHWAVERPAVFIDADINQAGNLSIRWRPAFGESSPKGEGPNQFTDEYLYQALRHPVGNYRPDVELLYVRGFWLSADPLAESFRHNRLLFAGWASYLSTVRRVGEFLQVLDSTPLEIAQRPEGEFAASLGPRVHPY